MRLSDILSDERVVVPLQATDASGVLQELAGVLSSDVDTFDSPSVTKVFEERETLASTGFGCGVAIPHGRLRGVESLRAALGISPGGVEFAAVDGQPVTIFVAVLSPDRQTGDHLKALARFSRILRREDVRAALLAAESTDTALQVLLDADQPR